MPSCRATAYASLAASGFAIGAAWLLNRDWFDFWRGAFSDLGSPRACCPWVFNLGLVASSILLLFTADGLYRATASRAAALGAGYLGLAAVFLAQVGIFPEGTRFHECVAIWFFLLADIGLLVYSAAEGLDGRGCRLGFVSSAILLPGALAVAATAGWPSTAALEAYAVFLLGIALTSIAHCVDKKVLLD